MAVTVSELDLATRKSAADLARARTALRSGLSAECFEPGRTSLRQCRLVYALALAIPLLCSESLPQDLQPAAE